MAVVDSRRLTRLLLTLPADSLPLPPRLSAGERLGMLWAGIASARPTPRSALVALALLVAYLLSGNGWYLFPALAVLGHMGVALIRHGPGRRLFEAD